ncbi:hypothetical protein [Aeoliella sp.]|uniref:hypothetical protein n=1 Tax=Aeoliella sp. TaxID=2795800 RepID=UPI003CCC11E7
MVTRLFVCLVAILVTAGCSWAQEPTATKFPPKETTAEDGDNAGEAEGTDADELFAGVDNEEPAAAEEAAAEPPEDALGAGDMPEEAAAEAGAPALTVDQLAIEDLRARLVELETEVEALKTNLAIAQSKIGQMVTADEFRDKTLGAMSEDAALRGRVGELLQGKVRLNNPTDESVVMYINGTAWTVVPGKSFVHAPVGTVSFLYDPAGEPEFKGIQEWDKVEGSDQFELEYEVRTPGMNANERSVVRQQ